MSKVCRHGPSPVCLCVSFPPCLSFLSICSLSSLSFLSVFLSLSPCLSFLSVCSLSSCLSYLSSCQVSCFLNVNSVLTTLYSLSSMCSTSSEDDCCLSLHTLHIRTIPRVSHLQCSLGGRTAGSWLLTSGTSHRPSSIKGAPPPSFRLIKHRWEHLFTAIL